MLHVEAVAFANRLRPVTFSIGLQDAMLITGANGTGKSTLLDCIGGLLKPTSGNIAIENNLSAAYLPQSPPRPFAYTVREYLMIGNHISAGLDAPTVLEITPFLDTCITKLSSGQWQRVAIAKVIASNRSVVILDEPDAPLDDKWTAILANLIESEVARGLTYVVTLHRPEIKNNWKFKHLNLKP